MSEAREASGGRSGCALFMGVLLIALGVLFLVQNLVVVPLFPLLRRSVGLFADYWPLLLLIWGAFKLFRRFTAPERARVSGLEIALLILVVGSGLMLRGARRVVAGMGGDVRIDEILDLAGLEILGTPAHRFSEERRFDLEPSPGAVIRIANPGGDVSIWGWEQPAIQVGVTKRVRHASEVEAARIAEDVGLHFQAEDEIARLSLTHPEGPSVVSTDLEIRVPKSASVFIDNRRGRVEAYELAGPLEIETGRGSIAAARIESGLRATTRHGDIRVDAVAGEVYLSSRGGNVTARSVAGDLQVQASHGRVAAEDVSGRAEIVNRHGSVEALRIGRGLEVSGQHASLSAESIGADAVLATSYRPVFVRGAEGNLRIETRHSEIQVRGIRGDVEIENPDGEVMVSGVKGGLRVRSPQARVSVEDVEGPVAIESSHDDVRITEFFGSLDVRSDHAGVRAETSRLGGNLAIENTYGDLELRLPEGASFRLLARIRDGELRSRIPGLDLEPAVDGAGRRWSGTHGTGAREVALATSYGDILLESGLP